MVVVSIETMSFLGLPRFRGIIYCCCGFDSCSDSEFRFAWTTLRLVETGSAVKSNSGSRPASSLLGRPGLRVLPVGLAPDISLIVTFAFVGLPRFALPDTLPSSSSSSNCLIRRSLDSEREPESENPSAVSSSCSFSPSASSSASSVPSSRLLLTKTRPVCRL